MKVPCPDLRAWLDQHPAVAPAVAAICTIPAVASSDIWLVGVLVGLCLVFLFLRPRMALWLVAAAALATVSVSLTAPRSLPSKYWYRQAAYVGEVQEVRARELSQTAILEITDSLGSFRCEMAVMGAGTTLTPGDSVRFYGTLLPPAALHPFDDASTRSKRLSAAISLPAEMIQVQGHTSRLRHLPAAIAATIIKAIDRCNWNDDTAALLKAAVFGQSTMPVGTDAFRAAGIAHLLCVSGFHVALVLALFAALLLPLKLWPGTYRQRLWILLPALWLFVLAAGASAPAVRAGIMLSLILLAELRERTIAGVNVLAAAVLLILLFDPWSFYSAGLWLSVCAVAGLTMLAHRLNPYTPADKYAYTFWGYPAAALSATIATLPLIIGVFHCVPLTGVPASVLTVPVFPVFVAVGLATAAVNAFGLPDGLLVKVSEWLANYIYGVADFFAGISSARYSGLFPDAAGMVLLVAGVALIVFVAPHLRRRHAAVIVCVSVFMLGCSFYRPQTRSRVETVFVNRTVLANHGDSLTMYVFSEEASPAQVQRLYFEECGLHPHNISVVRAPQRIVAQGDTIEVVRHRKALAPDTRAVYIATNSRKAVEQALNLPLRRVFIATTVKTGLRRKIMRHCRDNGIEAYDLALGPVTLPAATGR